MDVAGIIAWSASVGRDQAPAASEGQIRSVRTGSSVMSMRGDGTDGLMQVGS